MVPNTRNGERLTGRFINFFALSAALLLSLSATAFGQTPSFTCSTAATNLTDRSEGLAEPVGAIFLNCSGGTAGQQVMANLTLALNVPVTNRINAAGNPDILLTVDTGTGPVPTGNAPILPLGNTVSFNGIAFTIPPTRALTLRISNLRAAVGQQPVSASLSSTGLSLNAANVAVAMPAPGLLSIASSTSITCTGSPLPTSFDLPSFFAAGTRFTSTRVTEGFGNAFVPKDAVSDTGTRILVSYSGFPAGARVFLPDFVAGSSAVQPTAGGDLGHMQSGGVYAPSATGSLLLARVTNTDARGAGGAPLANAAAFTASTALTSASEVPLVNGAGVAVYEVIDANPSIQETAQFPAFATLIAPANQPPVTATAALSFAPVSTVAMATNTDPVPRFRAVPPPSDCSFLGDCGANYFPMLSVDTASLNFPGPFNNMTEFIRVTNVNAAGSMFSFTATTTYTNGTGFLFVDPVSGSSNSTLRVIASAAGLTPGIYQAQITIDAGAAGSRTVPVTLTVTAPPPPPVPVVTVSSVTNAASLQPGPLVPGSLATIKGTNLGGNTVTVAFDGIAAPILFHDAVQINFQVPASLAAKTSSQLVFTADGVSSAPQTISLAAVAPGIFGTLNQDGSVNSPNAPAKPGTIIQIFATGLTSATSGPVIVRIQGSDDLVPLYAGPAPGLTGVQQVNVALPLQFSTPVNLTTGARDLRVCGSPGDPTQHVCSPAVPLTVR